MNAAALQNPHVMVTTARAAEQHWCDCAPGMQMRVLSVDEARNSVEFVIKLEPGCHSGTHRHTCETFSYVLEGKLVNETTGVEFGPGDFCYQPLNDEHVEVAGPGGATVYASFRGTADTLVEFLDDTGAVTNKLTTSDCARMIAQ